MSSDAASASASASACSCVACLSLSSVPEKLSKLVSSLDHHGHVVPRPPLAQALLSFAAPGRQGAALCLAQSHRHFSLKARSHASLYLLLQHSAVHLLQVLKAPGNHGLSQAAAVFASEASTSWSFGECRRPLRSSSSSSALSSRSWNHPDLSPCFEAHLLQQLHRQSKSSNGEAGPLFSPIKSQLASASGSEYSFLIKRLVPGQKILQTKVATPHHFCKHSHL